MKLTKEQIEAAAGIIHYAVTSEKVKLRWGALQRQIMKDRIAAGLKVDGYRADWLRSTRSAIMEAMVKCSEEFNAKYPHDRISATDLVDALNTTLRALQTVKNALKGNSQGVS